jgi:hypothetical protein
MFSVSVQCIRIFCFSDQHNVLKSFVLVYFQAAGTEIQSYRNVCCALTDYEPVFSLIEKSVCKNRVQSRSEMKVWNKAWNKGKERER